MHLLCTDVGNHLIDIHVALGTGTGLPNGQGEFIRVSVFQNVVTGGALLAIVSLTARGGKGSVVK